MTNTNATNISISILTFLIVYFIPQPFLPILIYDYNSTTTTIRIWNIGLKPATDVLIEIIPKNGISISTITPSTISGESIINYSNDDRMIYYLHHVYSKDNLFFTLVTEQKINRDNIDIIIRSNEGSGIEATEYFQDLLKNLQIILIIAAIGLGSVIFVTVNKFLPPKKPT